MKKKILFLLRTYNDIDHIVPIIWKTATSGWPTFLLFVDKSYSEDYRICFARKHGAQLLRQPLIEWYHGCFRRIFYPRVLRRFCDRLIAYSFGLYFLKRYGIEVVANEWAGPFGRDRAEYFLRATVLLNLPVYSLPHGYFLWKTPKYNRVLSEYYKENSRFPDFTNRNWYTRYVVQSPEHKAVNIEHGMSPEKLVVLGSPRFCKEWSTVNYRLLCSGNKQGMKRKGFTVLFFLPHWDYNVHRDKCIQLMKNIGNLENIQLIIKAHTRGTGGLSIEEKNGFSSSSNVIVADDISHSTSLIHAADVVLNFGSSVAFEALRQGKPVINPTYLHDNETFFDHSGVTHDVNDEQSTIKSIIGWQSGRNMRIDQVGINEFLAYRVNGGDEKRDVLQDYLDLMSEE